MSYANLNDGTQLVDCTGTEALPPCDYCDCMAQWKLDAAGLKVWCCSRCRHLWYENISWMDKLTCWLHGWRWTHFA